MHVRDATREDLESVVQVHSAAVEGVRGTDAYDRRQVEAWNHERDPGDYPLADPDRRLVVAERDGAVVGFGQVAPGRGELEAVYVDPDHWGQGVGTALVTHLEGVAHEAGAGGLRLLASQNAVEFYEAAGYRVEGTETLETRGVELPCVRMAKSLGRGPSPRAWGELPA